MLSVFFSVGLSCVTTAIVTRWVREWATRHGVVDVPGGRHVHAQVTPRLGGIAIIAGFAAPLVVLSCLKTAAFNAFAAQSDRVTGLALGGLVVGTVGAVDDFRSLGPWKKLLAQSVGASIAYHFGFRVEAITMPGLGEISFGVFAFPVTLVWFLAITNAINLIDGLDGLAAGVALFACVSNLVLASFNGLHVVALLSACLAGALVGFLRHNFNPATIFMGDSGSMFIGFALAATSLIGATVKGSTAIGILAPMIAMGIPIFDTVLTVLRRTLSRQPVFQADRAHLHHRLVDMGFTHRRAVIVLYLGSIALAVLALGVALGRDWQIGLALVLVFATMITVVRTAGGLGLIRVPVQPELPELPSEPSSPLAVRNAAPAVGEALVIAPHVSAE